MTPPTALQSSTGVRHRTHTVLNSSTNTHLVCGPRLFKQALATQAASDLRLCLRLFFLFFLFSSLLLLFCFSLRLPPSVHISFFSLRFHPVFFHAAVCCQARGSYTVPGATLLGAVLMWDMINRLLQPALATQAASVLRLCLPLPFLFFFFFSSFFSLLLLSRAST